MKKYPLKLSPYISETIWGGRKLIDSFNIKTEKSNAAEAWMLSCLDDGSSTVTNGACAGKALPQVLSENTEWSGTHAEKFGEFPVLIKFIDAMDNLSVQVHPTDEYCKMTGKGHSKTECWYIIDCDKDACLLLGFKEKISKEQFKRSIEQGDLTDYVGKIKVKPGDFFFIEAGTLHAICKGVLLAEVQESSNTTYRIFDYNRLGKDGKPRELHISDAIGVTKTEPYSQPDFSHIVTPSGKMPLADCDLFKVWRYTVNGSFRDNCDDTSFVSLLVLSGSGYLTVCGERLEIHKGDSVFIPADSGEYDITGDTEILETRI